MGLASALTTSLTGLTAAETKIDVVGNNLANAQTVGFKQSNVVFATQFLQTYSLGSAPNGNSGGTNPKQIGLGVQVAEVAPDFTQGTIQISGNASDMAIQGDGFFIVEGSSGQPLYTRAGIFKTNANNELVTPDGSRLLGFGINEDFEIQETDLVPINIPLGQAAVAQPTSEVVVEGTLTPTTDKADTAEVIQSGVLGDGSLPQASAAGTTLGPVSAPATGGIAVNHVDGGGSHAEGAVYQYRFAYVDSSGTESPASSAMTITVPAGDTLANNAIQLNNLPPASGDYSQVRIYRTTDGGSDFFLLDTAAAGSNYVDDNSVPLSGTSLNDARLSGNYSYMITYARSGYPESRPTPLMGPVNVSNGRIQLNNLPTPPTPGPRDTFPAYDQVRIYRNLSTNSDEFYLVGAANPGDSFTDGRTDAEISDLSNPANKTIDLDGPRISSGTRLLDVVRRNNSTYEQMFEEGTLKLNHRKGGRTLGVQEFDIDNTTTVQQLIDFMNEAMGIAKPSDDPMNPIPTSLNRIPGESGNLSPGGSIVDGHLRFVSNNGEANALELPLSAFTIETSMGEIKNPSLGFGSIQEAVGGGAVADFLAYDTLGVPVDVRITTVLEKTDTTSTTYRWFAESADNDGLNSADVTVGTGLVVFDGDGNLVDVTNDRVSIERRDTPAATPLEFRLDFSKMSGLAAEEPTMSIARQDGAPPGTLTSFVVGEDGLVRGVFNNGTSKDLGQIRMARFANPAGLEQVGQNMFAQGVNSGISFTNPGSEGSGKLVSGATELSNTDVGRNLVDLVLASTLYRGNTRVINTSQELLDELMNLRR